MMEDDRSIAVLALDAADPALVEKWELENIPLDVMGELKTYAWTNEHPHTQELWPTIATGLHRDEHGVWPNDLVEWDDQTISTASQMAEKVVPQGIRTAIGEMLIRRGTATHQFPTTDCETFLDYTFEWPGVTDAPHIRAVRGLLEQVVEGTMSHRKLRQQLYVQFGRKTKWLSAEMPGIRGAHTHILDVAGHAYGSDEDRLQSYYEFVDREVGHLRSDVDELVIISDHGMQTSYLGQDENPGEHSFRAMISATDGMMAADCELPEDVLSVKEWIESKTVSADERYGIEGQTVESAVDRDHLEQLGYL